MTATDDTARRQGRFKRALSRLTTPDEDLHAQDLQESTATAGATSLSQCSNKGQVCLAGTVKHVVLRPRAGVPTLEAELWDGTGSVTLVFLGRRRIRGIDPGRSLIARGRLTTHEGRPTLYNPAYELRPTGT